MIIAAIETKPLFPERSRHMLYRTRSGTATKKAGCAFSTRPACYIYHRLFAPGSVHVPSPVESAGQQTSVPDDGRVLEMARGLGGGRVVDEADGRVLPRGPLIPSASPSACSCRPVVPDHLIRTQLF